MGFSNLFFGIVLPYIALAIFIIGIIYRIVKWVKGPQLLKWTLFPVHTSGEKLGLTLGQVFGFRSLFKYNRGLWLGAWLYHLSLAAIVLWHILDFIDVESDFWLNVMIYIDMIGKWVILGALIYLVLFRLALPAMRALSDTVVYFNLAVMLALVISGIYLKGNVDPLETGAYLGSLFILSPNPLPEGGAWLIIHWVFFLILLVSLPYGKMSHFLSQFFLKYRVDWVDWKVKKYQKAI